MYVGYKVRQNELTKKKKEVLDDQPIVLPSMLYPTEIDDNEPAYVYGEDHEPENIGTETFKSLFSVLTLNKKYHENGD